VRSRLSDTHARLERALRGDEQAVREIDRHLRSSLMKHVQGHALFDDIAHVHTADGIVDAALTRLFERGRAGIVPEDHGTHSLLKYVRAAVDGLIVDEWRKEHAAKRTGVMGSPAVNRIPRPSESWNAKDLRRFCIAMVNAEARPAFELAIDEGLTHEQIANRLRIPASQVKTQLERARDYLSRLFVGREWTR
jgi:DNA-directed RNA polymerase specialized sigma24 family protein